MLESLRGSMMSLLEERGDVEVALEAGSLGMLRTVCAGKALQLVLDNLRQRRCPECLRGGIFNY